MRAAGTALLLFVPALALAQTKAPVPAQSGAKPAPLTLQQLQELARQNDPRTAIARAQLDNAQGKRDEVSWAFFPNFETRISVAGPTPGASCIVSYMASTSFTSPPSISVTSLVGRLRTGSPKTRIVCVATAGMVAARIRGSGPNRGARYELPVTNCTLRTPR